jgi:hypothetical protein
MRQPASAAAIVQRANEPNHAPVIHALFSHL